MSVDQLAEGCQHVRRSFYSLQSIAARFPANWRTPVIYALANVGQRAGVRKEERKLCTLVLLCRKDYYGYELVQAISRNVDIAEGTVYPLLRRLTKEGYFTTYIQESAEGPARKYYQITEKGKEYQAVLLEEWTRFIGGVNTLLGGEATA